MSVEPDTAARRHGLLVTVGIPVLLLVFSVMGFYWMVKNPPEIPQREVEPDYPTVEVLSVKPETINLSLRSQGTVRPHTETYLKPEVSGKVVWISPSLVNGGVFRKDEKLLQIDDTDYRSALASSQTALVRADVELQHARRELERMESLFARKLASKAQLDNARRSEQLASAQHNEAQINKQRATIDMERTILRAPYAGRVRSETVDSGQFVSRGEEIAKIYATDYYEVHVPIGIEEYAFLKLPAGTQGALDPQDQPAARISGAIGALEFVWDGALERTEGEIDAKTRLLYGVIRVENKNVRLVGSAQRVDIPLLVGLYVKAEIQGRTANDVFRLPRSALRNESTVLVVDEGKALRFRQVDILRIQNNEVIVKSGLKPGEQVCIAPPLVVVEGMRVDTAEVSF